MNKARTRITKAVKDAVLDEFNYKCAICGADRPQLHHVDENPSNNDPLNLLPLCPNHHLTDQHNPTRRHEPRILKLFRQYKDPFILRPQFAVLFARTSFLRVEENLPFNSAITENGARELLAFIGGMEMGDYYVAKIKPLVLRPAFDPGSRRTTGNAQRDLDEGVRLRREQYQEALKRHRDDVLRLLVEILRFQNWR